MPVRTSSGSVPAHLPCLGIMAGRYVGWCTILGCIACELEDESGSYEITILAKILEDA